MLLPDHARADVLEFVGATPVTETLLSDVIDSFAKRPFSERRAAPADAS
jgi:hypothetical protein